MIDKGELRPASASGVNKNSWRSEFSLRLLVTDFLVLVWVVFGVQIAWFGLTASDVAFRGDLNDLVVNYSVISVFIVAAWLSVLKIYGTRAYRVIGEGSQEYKLIVDATIRLFGLVAIIAFLFQIDLARGYILIAFPLGLAVLLFSRWMWRQWLGVQRLRSKYTSRVLLVGSVSSADHIARVLAGRPEAGYQVVGACLPNSGLLEKLGASAIPVIGDFESVGDALTLSGADTVIITSADDLPPEKVRELSWSLEAGRQHLVVAPSLTDIGGPRIHTRPVAGLPLIHVETPRYEGMMKFTKRSFDIVGSGLILLLTLPLFIVVSVAVKATSSGPIFYRQQRIGLRGEPFDMLKFRSMTVDADDQLKRLLAEQGTGDTPLFKIRNDPRLTSVGGFIRRFSIDELPQLVNVLKGDMSLVGPRPQREGEVALYDNAARRRLIVQPGMTGLWQVSGRSNLSWEDAIRLDLFYVENWSLAGDIHILAKTARAVIAKDGAF